MENVDRDDFWVYRKWLELWLETRTVNRVRYHFLNVDVPTLANVKELEQQFHMGVLKKCVSFDDLSEGLVGN